MAEGTGGPGAGNGTADECELSFFSPKREFRERCFGEVLCHLRYFETKVFDDGVSKQLAAHFPSLGVRVFNGCGPSKLDFKITARAHTGNSFVSQAS